MINITGKIMVAIGLVMLLPLVVSLGYGEDAWVSFLVAALAAVGAGFLAVAATAGHHPPIRAREAFIITSSIWIFAGLFGFIPFMMKPVGLGFTDAFFEIISGYTTTGASIVTDVEALPKGILFWRALSQWIGGLGIILFMLALLPELNKSIGISMFNAEATGITHNKIHPRIRQTALSLWSIYLGLSAVSIILLWCGPMDLFDSVCHSFSAIATGGFTTRNLGLQYWHSDYVFWTVLGVMFVAGLNFLSLFNLWKGAWREFLRNAVVRTFSAITIAAYILLLVAALVRGAAHGWKDLLLYPLFHVVSAITSSGFGVPGAESWGPTSFFITLLLMQCGACAGSTSGGIKVDRIMVLWQNLCNEIKSTVFPRHTYVVRLDGNALDDGLVSRVSAFCAIYLIVSVASTIIVTFFGYSFQDSLFMVTSCIGCNGLGYGATGVEGGFAFLPGAVKWLLTGLMLMGRLELFTYIVLFIPSFWRR